MKNQNRKKMLVLAVAMIFTLGLGTAMAQPGRGMRFGGGSNGNGPGMSFGGGQNGNGPGMQFGQSDNGTGPRMHPPRQGGPDKRPGHFMRCVKHLDVTTETGDAIEALLEAEKENREEDREVMQEARDAYIAALTAEEIDDTTLIEAQEAIIALRQQHAESRFALELSVVELLSADEAAGLAECFATRPQRNEPPEESGSEIE
ncbi:MAG: hypothetical protein GY868_15835 [Deltaproteobacteria bacterium]|nr:hypothetical protein [Deltaproteobacteria bacterium]